MLLPTSTLTLVCVAGVGTPLHVARGSNGTKFTVRHFYAFLSIYTTLPFTNHITDTMSIRIASTFRLARSAVAPRAALPSISRARALSTSPVWRASEAAPQDPMADPKFQSFFDKIKNHQGAVDAMLKVGEVMKNKGTFGVSDSRSIWRRG